MVIEAVEPKTNIRYRNINDFESYVSARDTDYDSEDATFTGYSCKLKTPHFKVGKRSACAKGAKYMNEIVEYHGQNCYITIYRISFACVLLFR